MSKEREELEKSLNADQKALLEMIGFVSDGYNRGLEAAAKVLDDLPAKYTESAFRRATEKIRKLIKE